MNRTLAFDRLDKIDAANYFLLKLRSVRLISNTLIVSTLAHWWLLRDEKWEINALKHDEVATLTQFSAALLSFCFLCELVHVSIISNSSRLELNIQRN